MPRQDGRRWWFGVAIVAGVALALRLIHIYTIRDSALFSILIGDAAEYDAWARRIAGGDWLGTEVFYQTPLYPYAMAAVYALGAPDAFVIRVLQAGLGSLSCVFIALAGRQFFNPAAGLVAAALVAIYPPAMFFDGLIQKSSLDLVLITALLALAGAVATRPRLAPIVAAGVTLGLLTLNRENARVLVPVWILWIVLHLREHSLGRRLAWAGAFVIAVSMAVLPVALRNYRVGGALLVSTSQMGPNFYIGNHAGATGTYEALVPGRGNALYEREDATRLASSAVGRPLGSAEVSSYWLSKGLEFVRTEPAAWARLMGRKVLLALNHREAMDTESFDAYAERSAVLRSFGWFSFGALLPLAIFGGWQTRTGHRRLVLLYWTAGALFVSVVLFYVVARYRFVLVPVTALFAAAGLVDLVSRLRTRQSGWLMGGVAAAVAAVVTYVPLSGSFDDTKFNLGSELLRANRHAEAVPLLESSVAATPDYAPAHLHLGLALRETGRIDGAVASFRAAIALRPRYADAQHELAVTLDRIGDSSTAVTHAREAARLDPASARYRTTLGLVLWRLNAREEALTAFEAAAVADPASFAVRMNYAGALAALDRTADAIAAFERALSIAPDSVDIVLNLLDTLSELYERAGRVDAALATRQRAEALARAVKRGRGVP